MYIYILSISLSPSLSLSLSLSIYIYSYSCLVVIFVSLYVADVSAKASNMPSKGTSRNLAGYIKHVLMCTFMCMCFVIFVLCIFI